jgi:hypothetical protein
MKIGLRKTWLATTPSFVISTGAQRSGEICGFHIWRKERARYGAPRRVIFRFVDHDALEVDYLDYH